MINRLTNEQLAEMARELLALHDRIAALEAENKALREGVDGIAWYDDFLDADAARYFQNTARALLQDKPK